MGFFSHVCEVLLEFSAEDSHSDLNSLKAIFFLIKVR